MKYILILIIIPVIFSCNVEGGKKPQNEDITFLESPWPYPVHKTNYSLSKSYNKLKGYPTGGGTVSPDNSGVATLGLSGGRVSIKFNPPIENHPDNIGGYDFIVFGNTLWSGGDPAYPQIEPGFIEVMKDYKWYLLVHPSNRDYIEKTEVTYIIDDYGSDKWPDNLKSPAVFTSWLTKPGFNELIGLCDVTPTLKLGDMSGADGVSDNSLNDPEDNVSITPDLFYTVPDTPGDSNIDPGSGGGDAFDISWAYDYDTKQSVSISEVSWIRITTGKSNNIEHSTEIDAVTRVRRK